MLCCFCYNLKCCYVYVCLFTHIRCQICTLHYLLSFVMKIKKSENIKWCFFSINETCLEIWKKGEKKMKENKNVKLAYW